MKVLIGCIVADTISTCIVHIGTPQLAIANYVFHFMPVDPIKYFTYILQDNKYFYVQ